MLTVLDELAVFDEEIAAELSANLPALTATRMLMAAVAGGVGREEAHRIISEHVPKADKFFSAIAEDERLPISAVNVEQIKSNPLALTGDAAGQARSFADQARNLAEKFPNASTYQPESIL